MARDIIEDGQQSLNTSRFVGIVKDNDPEKPYVVITLHYSRRYKTERGARRKWESWRRFAAIVEDKRRYPGPCER